MQHHGLQNEKSQTNLEIIKVIVTEEQEVFKTRVRVVDDRLRKEKNTPGKESLIASKASLPSSPVRAAEQLAKHHDLLKSTSEIFMLPEIEAKYLEQFMIDSEHLKSLESKYLVLDAKMKEITRFIKSKIKEEDQYYTVYAVKIQSWWRGTCTRRLLSKGMGKNPASHSLKTNAATLIQRFWRSAKARRTGASQKKILTTIHQHTTMIQELTEKLETTSLLDLNHIKVFCFGLTSVASTFKPAGITGNYFASTKSYR
jgi:hypothetical protein